MYKDQFSIFINKDNKDEAKKEHLIYVPLEQLKNVIYIAKSLQLKLQNTKEIYRTYSHSKMETKTPMPFFSDLEKMMLKCI